MATQDPKQKRIVFLHPDLGIGGAERLVIDAAVGLQSRGHKVTIFTSYCDPSHCFEEARDGTLDVRVRGNSFPSSIFGRFAILCAIVRQIHLVLSIALFSHELESLRPTAFFVDQLSACVPLLRLVYPNAKILFYCHFPDQLLAQKSSGILGVVKWFYRLPFNLVESWSTGCSDGIVVNSRFTGGVVKKAFPRLKRRRLDCIYPCVDINVAHTERKPLWPGKEVLLSINRFERKKDVALAIKAFAGLNERDRKAARLVIAGGYDSRVPENVSYHKELEVLADSFQLTHETHKSLPDPSKISESTQILFLLSVSNSLKQSLLNSATLLIYTPLNEHFGIVPLEAMLNRVPVLAADQGGPLETVVDGSTGWLRPTSSARPWTQIMAEVLDMSRTQVGKLELAEMGTRGQKRVQAEFSKEKMAWRMEVEIDSLEKERRQDMFPMWLVWTVVLSTIAGVLGYVFMRLLFYMLELDLELERAGNESRALRSAKGEL